MTADLLGDHSFAPDDSEPDHERPFSVWIEGKRGALSVQARRQDGSVLMLMAGPALTLGEALRCAARVREAIRFDEEWVVALIGVSAGKLRG